MQGELQAHLNTRSLRVALLAEQQAAASSTQLTELQDKLSPGEVELARCQAECQRLDRRAQAQPSWATLSKVRRRSFVANGLACHGAGSHAIVADPDLLPALHLETLKFNPI